MSQGLPLKYCRDIRLDPPGSWTLRANTPVVTLEPDSFKTYEGHQALRKKLDANDTQWRDTTIRLDDVLWNNNGAFNWGGGNVSQSARNPSLKGTVLTAELGGPGGNLPTSVDLNDHLDGMNGVFSRTDAPRADPPPPPPPAPAPAPAPASAPAPKPFGPGEDAYISVDFIKIEPLYPVLDEFGQCPGFEFPLALWSPEKTSANPCTVDMNGGTEISVQITLKREDVTITSTAADLPCTFRVAATGPKTVLVHLTIRNSMSNYNVSLPTGIPWGCKREQTLWQFNYVVGPEKKPYMLSLKHPIEIYGVTPYTKNYKTKPAHYYGMPRDALDFYLIHAKKAFPEPINTLDDYVRSIVYAVHWCSGFAYDTVGGASGFAGEGFGDRCQFNVRLWAHLLHPTTKDEPLQSDGSHHVNCYDQAAAVWTGITLALGPRDVHKLTWRFADPFGHINPTHLVGWPDMTNDPFPMGDKKKPPQVIARGSERSSFGNHAFLEFDGGVLDATCGPYVGDVTLDGYLEASIDYDTGYESAPGVADGRRQSLLGSQRKRLDLILNRPRSVQANSDSTYGFKAREKCEQDIARRQRAIDQVETFGSATLDYVVRTPGERGMDDLGYSTKAPTDFRSAWPTLKALNIRPRCWGDNGIDAAERAKLPQEQSSEIQNRFVSVSKLLQFAAEIQKQFTWPASDRHTIEPTLRIIDFSPEYCHFSWKARSSATSAVSIDIYLLPDYDDATCWFAMRADPPGSSRSQGPLFARTDSSNASERSIAGINTRKGRVLHAVGNVVFEAHGLDKNEDLKPFENLFFQLLSSQKPEPTENLVKLDVQCTNAKASEGQDGAKQIEARSGDKLKFTAQAKNGFGLRCNLDNYWVVVPLQLNPEISKEEVTFEFSARNSGTETLEFVACDKWLDIANMQSVKYTIVVKD